jgi:DNA-binding XRE family transcriptional regulator
MASLYKKPVFVRGPKSGLRVKSKSKLTDFGPVSITAFPSIQDEVHGNTSRAEKISRTGQSHLTIHGSQSNFPERDNGMTKIMDSTQLGRLVRERRKQASLTLKDAAGMAGVGVRFLSELERGKPTVRIGLAIQVLQLFGLELHVHARGESR